MDSKHVARRVKKSILEEIGSKKEIEKERLEKLKLLFKACALVVYADGTVSPDEFMSLEVIFKELKIPDEDRHYFSSCLSKSVSVEEIKQEIKHNNYTREELEGMIELCTTIASVDELKEEEKEVIDKLRNIFGLVE